LDSPPQPYGVAGGAVGASGLGVLFKEPMSALLDNFHFPRLPLPVCFTGTVPMFSRRFADRAGHSTARRPTPPSTESGPVM
jgi:hypothetical protein